MLEIRSTPLVDALVLTPRVFSDERGWFKEAFNVARFQEHGLPIEFVQDNVSKSSHGVLRGLHDQWPNPQGKLVSVAHGEIWDVAVDARHGSPTFGQWHGEVLSSRNHAMFWIPEGFLHGFIALSEIAVVSYKTTALYDPSADGGVRWNDPTLAIEWPKKPLIASAKDQTLPFWDELPHGQRAIYRSS